jgi:hypothetical protein
MYVWEHFMLHGGKKLESLQGKKKKQHVHNAKPVP